MTQTPEEPIHPEMRKNGNGGGNGGGNGSPPPLPPRTPNPIPPGNYLVTLVALSCDKSRATFIDTIWIGAAAQSNLQNPAQWQTQFVGDIGNGSGYHEFNIDVAIIRVNPGEELKFCHIILNYGSNNDVPPQSVLDTLAEVAISELTPVAFVRPLDLQQVSDNVNNLLLNPFRGCDGLVAATNFKLTSDQLEQGTQWSPPWAGSEIGIWTEERGFDSAIGCGANSHYWVQWIIKRYQ